MLVGDRKAAAPDERALLIERLKEAGASHEEIEAAIAEVLRDAESEVEFALRSERAARGLRRDLGVWLESTMETQLRGRLAREALTRAEVESGSLPGAREVAV